MHKKSKTLESLKLQGFQGLLIGPSVHKGLDQNIIFRLQIHIFPLGIFEIRTFVFSDSLYYNEAITRKGADFMKEKHYVTLSDHERRIVVLSLNRLRNRVIADGIDPIDVDRMLLKMVRLNKKRFGRA